MMGSDTGKHLCFCAASAAYLYRIVLPALFISLIDGTKPIYYCLMFTSLASIFFFVSPPICSGSLKDYIGSLDLLPFTIKSIDESHHERRRSRRLRSHGQQPGLHHPPGGAEQPEIRPPTVPLHRGAKDEQKLPRAELDRPRCNHRIRVLGLFARWLLASPAWKDPKGPAAEFPRNRPGRIDGSPGSTQGCY